ncbi:protein of unknown function [Azospirillum baldaniorum]|uniref:Uncharacterized protein n=1 Tax=Azospirillum baldaniorum TaxID=1064539 RepID=A0A9P1JSF9_9PROT|nr:protein of unknown function [Azospirillum baldaniorum]
MWRSPIPTILRCWRSRFPPTSRPRGPKRPPGTDAASAKKVPAKKVPVAPVVETTVRPARCFGGIAAMATGNDAATGRFVAKESNAHASAWAGPRSRFSVLSARSSGPHLSGRLDR